MAKDNDKVEHVQISMVEGLAMLAVNQEAPQPTSGILVLFARPDEVAGHGRYKFAYIPLGNCMAWMEALGHFLADHPPVQSIVEGLTEILTTRQLAGLAGHASEHEPAEES